MIYMNIYIYIYIYHAIYAYIYLPFANIYTSMPYLKTYYI